MVTGRLGAAHAAVARCVPHRRPEAADRSTARAPAVRGIHRRLDSGLARDAEVRRRPDAERAGLDRRRRDPGRLDRVGAWHADAARSGGPCAVTGGSYRPYGREPARIRQGPESGIRRHAGGSGGGRRTRDAGGGVARSPVPNGTAGHHQVRRPEPDALSEPRREHALPVVAGHSVVRQARPQTRSGGTRRRERQRARPGHLVGHRGQDQDELRAVVLRPSERAPDARDTRPDAAPRKDRTGTLQRWSRGSAGRDSCPGRADQTAQRTGDPGNRATSPAHAPECPAGTARRRTAGRTGKTSPAAGARPARLRHTGGTCPRP